MSTVAGTSDDAGADETMIFSPEQLALIDQLIANRVATGSCLAIRIYDGLRQQRRSDGPPSVALVSRYRDRQSCVLGGPGAPPWLWLCPA